jgi:LuxR family maltose regulon positive regulatory protein
MTAIPSPQHLAPPTFRVALAVREQLLDRLRAATDRRVILLDAPAGYGKTWLLSRWYMELRNRGTRVVWLGVDDSDVSQFLGLLIAGLNKAGLDTSRLEAIAMQELAEVPLASVIAGVRVALEADGEPVFVFVDDLHRLSRKAAHDVLQRLFLECASQVRFACSGRDCAALPIAALRARGDVLAMGVDELRFGVAEVSELLPTLSQQQCSMLLERTEGWPVAVQLARLWLEAKPKRSELLSAFSGGTSEVAEYLTEQVLKDLGVSVQGMLSDLSILDSLNPDVVAAVVGRERAWVELLSGGSLEHFLVPLDEERYWFRLHHLLLDYLRAQRRKGGDDDRHLHRRASAWFAAHGGLREAVRHAVLAEDLPLAASLVERAGGWEMVLFGGTSLMRNLLAVLPQDVSNQFPRLQLFHAFLAAKDGNLARGVRIFESVRAATVGSTDGALARDLLVVGHLIGRYADRPVEPGDLDALYREIDALPAGDDVARATLANTACLLALGIGDMRAALEACLRAVREMRRIGSLLGLNYCLCHLGLVHWHLGARREAEALWSEAAGMAEENFGADSGLKAIADVYLGLALHARGDVAGASERFGASLDQVEATDGWLDLYAEAYEQAIANASARGDTRTAASLVERMTGTAARRGLDRLERLAQAFRCRWQPSPGKLTAGVEQLPWNAMRWKSQPSAWREHHAAGLVITLEALRRDNAAEALETIADLVAAARSGHRLRDLRQLAVLNAAARWQAGEGESVLVDLAASLDESIREDDTQFLVDFGVVLLPLLQAAWTWSRDRWPSSSGRQVLAGAVTTLARSAAGGGVGADCALSSRELEVLTELASGAPNKVIARRLQMTENTVKFHLKHVFQKLRVRHRAEAIQAARSRGLLR